MRSVWVALMAAAIWPVAAIAEPGLNPEWGTIFPALHARELARQCSQDAPSPVTGTWQPTAAQITTLEPKLAALLTVRLAKQENVRLSVSDYYRQYGGLIVGGRRIIYVNGFHRELIDHDVRLHMPVVDWLKVPALVCDGGWLTFGVEYDPATGALAHFAFNGTI